MSGQLREMEKTIHGLKAALLALDSTIRVFAPAFDPNTIAPKRPIRRSTLFKHGELTGLCVDHLRRAAGPVGAVEIMEAICADKEIERDRILTERVLSTLRSMFKRGTVTREGEAPHVYWMLSPATAEN